MCVCVCDARVLVCESEKCNVTTRQLTIYSVSWLTNTQAPAKCQAYWAKHSNQQKQNLPLYGLVNKRREEIKAKVKHNIIIYKKIERLLCVPI